MPKKYIALSDLYRIGKEFISVMNQSLVSFLNYYHILFCMVDVHIVGLPEIVVKEFKIVQLYYLNMPILLCGVRKSPVDPDYYHAKILEKYLLKNGISFDTFIPNPDISSFKAPLPSMDGVYSVVGMGYSGIDPFNLIIKLPHSSSHDYNISPDVGFNNLLKRTFSNLGYQFF